MIHTIIDRFALVLVPSQRAQAWFQLARFEALLLCMMALLPLAVLGAVYGLPTRVLAITMLLSTLCVIVIGLVNVRRGLLVAMLGFTGVILAHTLTTMGISLASLSALVFFLMFWLGLIEGLQDKMILVITGLAALSLISAAVAVRQNMVAAPYIIIAASGICGLLIGGTRVVIWPMVAFILEASKQHFSQYPQPTFWLLVKSCPIPLMNSHRLIDTLVIRSASDEIDHEHAPWWLRKRLHAALMNDIQTKHDAITSDLTKLRRSQAAAYRQADTLFVQEVLSCARWQDLLTLNTATSPPLITLQAQVHGFLREATITLQELEALSPADTLTEALSAKDKYDHLLAEAQHTKAHTDAYTIPLDELIHTQPESQAAGIVRVIETFQSQNHTDSPIIPYVRMGAPLIMHLQEEYNQLDARLRHHLSRLLRAHYSDAARIYWLTYGDFQPILALLTTDYATPADTSADALTTAIDARLNALKFLLRKLEGATIAHDHLSADENRWHAKLVALMENIRQAERQTNFVNRVIPLRSARGLVSELITKETSAHWLVLSPTADGLASHHNPWHRIASHVYATFTELIQLHEVYLKRVMFWITQADTLDELLAIDLRHLPDNFSSLREALIRGFEASSLDYAYSFVPFMEALKEWQMTRRLDDPNEGAVGNILRLVREKIIVSINIFWQSIDNVDDLTARIDGHLAALEGTPTTPEAFQKAFSALALTLRELEGIEGRRERLISREKRTIITRLKALLNELLNADDRDESFSAAVAALTQMLEEQDTEWTVLKGIGRDRRTIQIVHLTNPWHTLISRVRTGIIQFEAVFAQFDEWVEAYIGELLTAVTKVEDIASWELPVENVLTIESGMTVRVQSTLVEMLKISREANAALQFRHGSHNFMVNITETHLLLNQLRASLGTFFGHEAYEWIAELKRISLLMQQLKEGSSTERGNERFVNPYIAGNPIRALRSGKRAPLFKGREALRDQIVTHLSGSARPTLILYGPRRMGKTSFLYQLSPLLPDDFIPVLFDVQSGGASMSEANFFYRLAKSIHTQLNRNYGAKIARPQLNDYDANPLSHIDDWFEDEVLPVLGERRLFITIDEFEMIGMAIKNGDLSKHTLAQLRAMMQHHEQVMIMFVGVQTLEALGPNAPSHFINAHTMEISYLSEMDTRELITNPDPTITRFPTFPDEIVDHIVYLTKGQPFLVQKLCSELIDILNEKQDDTISADLLRTSIRRVFQRANMYFRYIWDTAGPAGQELLRCLRNGPSTLPLHADEAQQACQQLERTHVITRRSDGIYTVEIPLMQLWLKQISAS